MIFPGTTDGSTIEPGEVNPAGGLLEALAGTVWFQFQATAPGFMTVVAERAGEPMEEWPYIGVWEGDTADASKASLLLVRPARLPPLGGDLNEFEPGPFFYEIREDKFYFIQVIRRAWQSWGDFDLLVDPFYETIDWDYATDGFDDTTGSPAEAGGVATMSGDIQYGTFDAGDEPPRLNREFRVYMEIECVSGEILVRHNSDLEELKLGIFRIRDLDDNEVFHCYLYPGDQGDNILTFAGDSYWADVSIGTKISDQSGWVSIEMIFMSSNDQAYDEEDDIRWRLENVLVNGREHSGFNGFPEWTSKRPRYFDFGFWRYSVVTAPEVEDVQTWEIDYRRMGVTNIVPRQPYDYHSDDRKILQFDGWAQGTSYHSMIHGSGGSWDGSFFIPTLAGDEPSRAYLDVVASPGDRGGFAVRSLIPAAGDYSPQMTYGAHVGSRRWYGFWMYGDEYPDPEEDPFEALAGWNYQNRSFSNNGLAGLSLKGRQLQITPYVRPHFCVAIPKIGEWYWIEVHVDAEVLWDVQVEIFINGNSFGVFSNKATWGVVGAGVINHEYYGNNYITTRHSNAFAGTTVFALGLVTDSVDHDLYFGTVVVGRGDPDDQAGPLDVVAQPAIDDVGTHNIPALPGEFIDLWGNRNGANPHFAEAAWRVYGWDVADGPDSFTQAWPPPAPFYPGGGGAPTVENTTRSFVNPTQGALGDSVLAVVMASGAGFLDGAAQEWDPGGLGGSLEPTNTHPTLALSGTPTLAWATALPFWVSSLGTGVIPRISWQLGSGTLTMTDYRLLQNPLIYPRYAYTSDGGTTYTWIDPTETASAALIDDDVTVDGGTNKPAIFTDTIGGLRRMQVNDGNIAGHGGTAHRAFNMPQWYLEYEAAPTESVDPVRAVNIWTRFRGAWGEPQLEEVLYSGRLRVEVALDSGGHGPTKVFSNNSEGFTVMGGHMDDLAVIDRVMLPRDPIGELWTPEKIEELLIRVGYHEYFLCGDIQDYDLHTDAQACQSDQRFGAILYAMSIERLVDAEAGDSPSACFTLVSMNWREADRSGVATRVLLGH